MKFLIVPRGVSPIFTAYITFPVGAADEEKGKTGLAHFVEHMAFKGTERFRETELVRAIEREGGQGYNATTSKDLTTYMVSFPVDRLEFWASLEAERIFRPLFRDFDKEREVILQERRMRIDNDPDGKLYEAFIEKAFQGTPYEWPTIGYAKDLRALTQDDLDTFWKRHYFPAGSVGVLVGRLDPKKTEAILRKTFGRVKGRLKRAAQPAVERPEDSSFRFHLKEAARPRILIGYRKPPLPDRDDYVFDVLGEILSEGRSSRLYRSLVQKKKLVQSISTYTSAPGTRGWNLFIISMTTLGDGRLETVLEAFDKEVEDLKNHGIEPRELEKALNRLTADLLWGLETNSGLASQLSFFFVSTGDWRYLRNYVQNVETITVDEVLEVAHKYLDPGRRLVGTLGP
jgi:predicted Zn-dependent peptidase